MATSARINGAKGGWACERLPLTEEPKRAGSQVPP